MRKTLSILHRIVLTAGVLVALTPCGFCQNGVAKPSQACPMAHMSGRMDCCHKAKSSSPLCQIMDQSSVAVSAVHANTVVTPVVSAVVEAPSTWAAAAVPPSVSFSSSPPRGPLALRI